MFFVKIFIFVYRTGFVYFCVAYIFTLLFYFVAVRNVISEDDLWEKNCTVLLKAMLH